MKERDCANCKHHTSDGCTKWDCEFEAKDLISRADAINAVHKYFVDAFNNEPHEIDEDGDDVFTDMKSVNALLHHNKMVSKALKALPSAELTLQTPQTYGKSINPSADTVSREFYEDAVKANIGLVIENRELKEKIESADAEWIPCNKKMPDELKAVNITWVNHNPPPYYKHIKDVPLVDSAVYYRGKWYWWDATVIDVLAEYGEDCNAEQIDKDIEIIAWMPLPKPYREKSEVEE